MLRALIPFSLALILASHSLGCGRVNGNDYDQSCQQDSDCEVVTLAVDCTCDDVMSVNVSERDRVDRDNARVERREFCPGGVTECDRAYLEPFCNMNQCDMREPEEEPNP